MITTENLSYKYKNEKKDILKNVSVHFEKGDFCAIIGPNGSGKTTLLKVLARILPTNHNIIINNKNLDKLKTRDIAKNIAYVPQYNDSLFNFSVFDTVMMGRNPHQNRWETFSSKDKEIVMEALEMTHLINVQNKFTDQLSGGERQRVLIARAIAQNTPILLLDEPLSNLDITHQFEIMDILSQLNENQKITILIVVHNLSIINQYAKKILMLKNGKVFRYGELKNVLNPKNIKNLYDLMERLSVDMSGNITKNSNF